MRKICKLFINEQPYKFEVEGDFFWGENKLQYQIENSPISKMQWHNDGYAIVNAFNNSEFIKLKESVIQNIVSAIDQNVSGFDSNNFILDDYHKVINTDALHNKVINITRNLENKDFDFDIDALADKFGELLGCKLTTWIEELKKSHIQVRISRPNSLDINPPHRDGYLSYFKDILNLWIPIHGCNNQSSLPVMPSSHLIPENEILRTASKGAKINGNTYYVPCILETNKGAIKMIRPNPMEGEALIFTPFLIHGAAVNNNKDITRISLELRFPKSKN